MKLTVAMPMRRTRSNVNVVCRARYKFECTSCKIRISSFRENLFQIFAHGVNLKYRLIRSCIQLNFLNFVQNFQPANFEKLINFQMTISTCNQLVAKELEISLEYEYLDLEQPITLQGDYSASVPIFLNN